MTLENNCTFISPHNQRITHIDSCPHRKNRKATADSYGFDYPPFTSLIDTVITQEDNEFPHHQYTSGCSFDNIVWQQAIGASKNMDHNHCGCDMNDEEKVLFKLVLAGIIDHQEFDEPHKWLSHSIRYSTVVADHLWALYEAEHSRNNRLKCDLNSLKGQVTLMQSRLLAVDQYSFNANTKVNKELKKDGEKHNALVLHVSNMSDQMDLFCQSLIALRGSMCTCNRPETPPVNSSSAAPSFSHSPLSSPPAPALVSELVDVIAHFHIPL
ncbi:hypothetical protein BDM02DRAFT_3192985 [Thelephora ganbajun]|uniref:Uncharacterized protein n=1 Tax=Thelephora ganbajun TaxID=370292 RepID=A0ACB6YZL9_THEGA|nr:hypothetical protein BDM02DRAFT_3192985 [Thelephora ganbajun]